MVTCPDSRAYFRSVCKRALEKVEIEKKKVRVGQLIKKEKKNTVYAANYTRTVNSDNSAAE